MNNDEGLLSTVHAQNNDLLYLEVHKNSTVIKGWMINILLLFIVCQPVCS